jgi:transcriptional regulator with GAF, ATPase, and Fis domain
MKKDFDGEESMKATSLSTGSAVGGFDSPSNVIPLFQKNEKVFNLFVRVQGAMRHVPDFVQTCKAILDAVIDEMDAENCSVMLKDPVSGELSILASRGKNDKENGYSPDPSAEANRPRLKEGIAGWVLKEGEAVMVNDVKEEPRFIKVTGLNNKVRSLICFPLREKDQVVGVFNLSHSKKGAFDEGDKLALGFISNQVGAALTSARFFMEIQEMNRLKHEFGEPLPLGEETVIPSPSTFIEVGEIMERERGIFIYTSEKMHQIKEIIDQVANTDVTVLIQGESGVGKEVVARSIHLNSFRRDKPFVKVNCAALPSELLESELFGYEKGAFTGAYRQKPGKFELANGGTIFLDEIVEISLPLQAKLLQVLQDREFSRLGGKKDIRVDVRILVATNKNIEEAVKNDRFREDLYYRLNVVNITIPPLRERKEEIPIFVEYLLDKFGKKYRKKVKPLSDQIMKVFFQYHWLGNVRELENVIQRIIVLGNEKVILDELASAINKEPTQITNVPNPNRKWPSLKEVQREATVKAEAEVIRKALEMTNWNRKKAADLLNISYKALLYKIKECGIGKHPTSVLL